MVFSYEVIGRFAIFFHYVTFKAPAKLDISLGRKAITIGNSFKEVSDSFALTKTY